jgi:hypothetical protein
MNAIQDLKIQHIPILSRLFEEFPAGEKFIIIMDILPDATNGLPDSGGP